MKPLRSRFYYYFVGFFFGGCNATGIDMKLHHGAPLVISGLYFLAVGAILAYFARRATDDDKRDTGKQDR